MFHWALIFLVIAVVSAAFGFTNIASESARIAKVCFAIFFVLFLVSLVLQLMG